MGEHLELGIPGLGPATPVARGGFAQVYRAEQLSFGRTVAVKVLFAPPSDAAAFARFERECLALGAVANHPNIVVVHDRGLTADGRPYIIMEYRPGGSLADRLDEGGPLTPAQASDIGAKICDALTVAHQAGVIHRDVKPANILLSSYDEPALADFGIARIDGGHKTATGQISASLVHASREVLDGDEPTAQSDIYSLGSTMLELCTGSAPFYRPDEAAVWPLINRVMTEDAPHPGSLGVPEPLASAIAQALSHDRSVRHSDARELGRHLRLGVPPQSGAVTTEVPSHLAPSPDTANETGETVAVDGLVSPHKPKRRLGGRRASYLVAILVVALAALAGAASLGIGPDLGFLAGAEPEPELLFPQALIEPLDTGRNYALSVRNAPEGARLQLLVDGDELDGGDGPIILYRPTPGRHHIAVEVLDDDGAAATTEVVEVYASPGPPPLGYRVNLAAVRIRPQNWPAALRQFDQLVDEGHKDLVLSAGVSGEYWTFYVAGYGPDRDAAWRYCEDFDLTSDECFAAEVRAEEG